MSSRDQLRSYLNRVEKRLRLSVIFRGAGILAFVALVATILLVLVSNAFAFSQVSITSARVILFFSVAATVVLALALPLYFLDRHRATRRAEAVFPEFEQRLVTFVDRDAHEPDPFMELLAADTLQLTSKAEPGRLAPDRKLLLALGSACACLAILIWMIMAGPGFWGYGAKRLWAGSPPGIGAFYGVHVTPGDTLIRRNSSQVVTAQLIGFASPEARLYARYQSASKWDPATMQPRPGAPGFQFVLASIPEDVEYYVQAGRVRSRQYRIRVVDLPSIKQIRVTYHYPAWTGLKSAVQSAGGDLRAVEGSTAELAISTDRPVRGGILALNDRRKIALSGGEGNTYKGTIPIQKDGSYHVAGLDRGQIARLSDEFLIDAGKANPPQVSLIRPGHDYQASPIEEVTVTADARDDYGLKDLRLDYSVNGGPVKSVSVLRRKGATHAMGSTVLHLEDFKVVPGDLVSVYASARDGKLQARTGMLFVEVQPFEREYSQSQISGGGGLSAEQYEFSQREKEIIAASWNQQRNRQATRKQSAANGKFLSSVQSKLRDHVLGLTGRMEGRGLGDENQEFSAYQRDMNAAAKAMGPASQRLNRERWTDAISSEEQALQQLLRAEATFRRIQVAFGSRGGGGGGAGAGRDLANLADLELNTEKNQYETAQTAESQRQQTQQTDKALQKLEELARREQQLAEQQHNSSNSSFQQRWQQEMLHRQAEQLQRQLEQLAENRGQPGGQANSASASQPGSGASQGAAGEPIQRVIDQLRRASKEMAGKQMDGSGSQQAGSAAAARRAASRLKQAAKLLAQMQRRQVSPQLDSLSRQANRLASEEGDQAARMRRMFGNKAQTTPLAQSWFNSGNMSQSKLADDRQLLANDLSRLEQAMQDAARELKSTQPGAAAKLQQSLGQMDQAELPSRLRRSAESIRYGFDPNSKTMEPAISAGIQQIGQGIREAQQALKAQPQNPVEEALNRVDQLRSAIQALTRNAANSGAPIGQPGAQSQAGQGGQSGQGGQQQAQGNQTGSANGGLQPGAPGGPRAWQRVGGSGTFIQQPGSGSPGDAAAFEGAQQAIEALRRELRTEPGSLPDLQKLMRDLQHLGPRRFQANPALVQQLGARALTSVDNLELQLRRELDAKQSGEVRASDSFRIPPGYQESVATYFRRLSKGR